jgi:hypothetical protein
MSSETARRFLLGTATRREPLAVGSKPGVVGIKCADSSAHGLLFIRRLEAIASLVTTIFMASRVFDAIEDYHCHDGPQASGRVRAFKCRCLGSWNPAPEKPLHLSSDGACGSSPASAGGPHVRALRLFTAALIWTSAFAKVRGIACTGHGSKVPPPVKQWVNAKHNGRRRPCSALSKPDVSCCRWQRRR